MHYTILVLGVFAMITWALGIWPHATTFWSIIFLFQLGLDELVRIRNDKDDGLW